MDFKQAIIENAWAGINIDYGMLHLQLATPTAVLVVILVMIFTLNKLLFKPVLRTLDNRKENIKESQNKMNLASEELVKLEDEFQKKINNVRTEVIHLKNTGHEKGIAKKELLISEKRTELHIELEKNLNDLNGQIKTAKNEFSKLNQELSASISKQLLS